MGQQVVVLGSQWGDEGKGKIVDWLSNRADAVVRYQGGNNAGHTIVIGDKTLALRLIPSGIIREGVQCFLGRGVVLNPAGFLEELDGLNQQGFKTEGRLGVSFACPLVLPFHITLDKAREKARGNNPIGTTGRGIGPAYEDKVARRGLRLQDALNEQQFAERLATVMDYHNFVLKHYYEETPLDVQAVLETTLAQVERIKPMVCDVAGALKALQSQDKRILFEGAQGTWLDIDLGTYPYVTSSNTTAGAVSTGTGMGPRHLDYVLGITKAYTTRVGSGPFPTELSDEAGETLGKRGHEFGTVTGRPRRCGWLDLPLLKRSSFYNSFDGLCLTKLDVLDTFERIGVAVAYELEGQRLEEPPVSPEEFARCTPVYTFLEGWQCSTEGVTTFDALPEQAQAYVRFIESQLGVPVDVLSTGPERDETIILRDPFEPKE